LWTKDHQIMSQCCFPIVDILLHSGDSYNQSLKSSKI